MSRFKKILWTLFFFFLAGSIAFFLWWRFVAQSKNWNALSLIPQDAMYILEARQPIQAWKSVSQSKIWQHLKTNSLFKEIGESANALDSLIHHNDKLFSFFEDHELYISAHPTKPRQYDFLFLIDIKSGSKLDLLQSLLTELSKFAGYSSIQTPYKKFTISTLTDKATDENIYFSILGNQLVCSFHLELLKKSMDAPENPFLLNNLHFKSISDRIGSDGPFNIYIQGRYLDDYLACYQATPDPVIMDMSRIMAWGGLSTTIDNDQLNLKGSVNIYDSLPSYLQAMLVSGNGNIENQRYIPSDAAQHISLGFKDFGVFYEQFQTLLQKDPKAWTEFENTNKQLEKYLDISIKDHFVSWIGEEVSYSVIPPSDSLITKDLLVTIKASQVEKMEDALKHIQKKIRRRTPFRFKETEYKGYTIKGLYVKGFFKVLFGKFFDKFDKPFYLQLDDRILFSNHEQTLKKVIDDYTAGKTLAASEPFMQLLKSTGGEKANLFGYVQMKHYLPIMLKEVLPSTRNSILKNKAYFDCFPHIAFKLKGQEALADISLTAQYFDPSVKAILADEGVLDSISTDSLAHPFIIKNGKKLTYFEDGTLKTETEVDESLLEHGTHREYYPNGDIKVKGKFEKGVKKGVWKYYDMQGDIERKEDFDEIKADSTAT